MLGCILWNNKKIASNYRDPSLTYFFEPRTKLNFSCNNPNSFYILTSNTITDKCNLVRDFSKLFQQGLLPCHYRFPFPTLTELMFILCRYLISQLLETSLRMRLLRNNLITNNAGVLWKVYFWVGSLPL